MVIKLADRTISVKTIYPYTEKLCRDYMADGEPDIDIVISDADIDFERKRSEDDFADGYLESLAVYRKIAERMPGFDTVLFHGSAVAVDGAGYIFAAVSGTGKSTHAGLWRQVLGDRVITVNDDKPLIRVAGDRAFVYGTPWDGKHRLSSNVCVPIKAVCILERGLENSIEEIGVSEAMPALIQQTYRPADPAAMALTLTLIDRMASYVKLYRMKCNMEPSAARMAYERMSR